MAYTDVIESFRTAGPIGISFLMILVPCVYILIKDIMTLIRIWIGQEEDWYDE